MNNFLDILTHHDVATIDLHDYEHPPEALLFLERELYRLYTDGEQYVRIIHGVGEGVMVKYVHNGLRENQLVRDFQLERNDGSTIVSL